MVAESTDLAPPPPEPTASPEPEILHRKDDRDWKADMMSALGESVSFGRFLSEPLDWGKWSAFHHNRYLDEAAGQSRPGSVARKKAFFEDRYARKRKSEADADADADQDVDARGVDTDAAAYGGACWSAGSSCMTDEPAGGVDSSTDFGVVVGDAPVDDAQEELKAVADGAGLACGFGDTDERSHHVQAAEARKGLRLDDGGIVAAADSPEKQPLQDSSIVNQGITDSVKNRRFPISSLFQKPMEFSSPPSGKKTPSSSVKRRSMLRSAKENSSPSPSTDSNKQEEASVAHKRSTFGALPMSTNLRRREIVNPTSRSRYLGSTIASRISQLDSASRPLKDSHPKVNQFRQTKKGFFKGMPEIASRTSPQHEQRSSHVSVARVKEKLFGSTASLVHPKTNIAKENMVNANNESELKEMSPSIRFKARQPPNFYWKNKEPKDSSQQSAQETPDLPNNDHQLNDASKPHVMSRGAPKDKQTCCFPLRRLC